MVLSQLLFALEVLRGTHLPPDMVATTEQARAEITSLTGDCIEEQMRAMQAFALTPMEAQVFFILTTAGRKPISEDMVMRRADHDYPVGLSFHSFMPRAVSTAVNNSAFGTGFVRRTSSGFRPLPCTVASAA